MKRIIFAVLLAAGILSACVVASGPHGHSVVVAPALPTIVVLEEEPYYYHSGYYYYYRSGGWSYSHSKNGPWAELPRGHYPKEVRFKEKGRGDDRGKGSGHGRGRDD